MAAGRPSKYDSKYNRQVFKLALLGAKDKEIADFLEISESTLNKWKLDFPELSESLKKGKIQADMMVSKSLFKRANGFYFDEVTHEQIEMKQGSGESKIVVPATLKKTVRKFIIPDTTAQIFWLKNRKPEEWRDKVDHQIDEELTITVKHES